MKLSELENIKNKDFSKGKKCIIFKIVQKIIKKFRKKY